MKPLEDAGKNRQNTKWHTEDEPGPPRSLSTTDKANPVSSDRRVSGSLGLREVGINRKGHQGTFGG